MSKYVMLGQGCKSSIVKLNNSLNKKEVKVIGDICRDICDTFVDCIADYGVTKFESNIVVLLNGVEYSLNISSE